MGKADFREFVVNNLQEISPTLSIMSGAVCLTRSFLLVGKDSRSIVHITGIVTMPAINKVLRTNSTIFIRGPISSVNCLYPCLSFLQVLGKTEKTHASFLCNNALSIRTLKNHALYDHCRPQGKQLRNAEIGCRPEVFVRRCE